MGMTMKPQTRLTLARLVLPMVAIFAVSVLGFLLVYLRADSEGRSELEVEIAKGMVTLIAGVIISGILIVIVRDFEARRKKLIEEQEELRKRHRLLRSELLKEVSTRYLQLKALRRNLRARVTKDKQIDARHYAEAMKELNDIQLGLERCVEQAENGVREYAVPESVPAQLKSMEKFLGHLVTEYEGAGPSDKKLTLEALPMLRNLIGRYQESQFRADFVHAYRAAKEAVAMSGDH
jgi:hypothetical protein